MALLIRGRRSALGYRCRLVDESPSESSSGDPGGIDGLVATTETNACDLTLGPRLPSDKYQRFLQGHNLICSMSAVRSCADNAAAKILFGLLKREHSLGSTPLGDLPSCHRSA